MYDSVSAGRVGDHTKLINHQQLKKLAKAPVGVVVKLCGWSWREIWRFRNVNGEDKDLMQPK
ncbi:hypothetical protein Csa_014935, partial [Cucumis sativus]